MTFRQALDRHLLAIPGRDLAGSIETLPQNELTLITSDGRLVRSVTEFTEMHRGWFAETNARQTRANRKGTAAGP